MSVSKPLLCRTGIAILAVHRWQNHREDVAEHDDAGHGPRHEQYQRVGRIPARGASVTASDESLADESCTSRANQHPIGTSTASPEYITRRACAVAYALCGMAYAL